MIDVVIRVFPIVAYTLPVMSVAIVGVGLVWVLAVIANELFKKWRKT